MRRIGKRLLLASAVAALALSVVPAGAASGGGTVTGTVAVSPGLLPTPAMQTFTFSPIILSGTFSHNNVTYSGQITTSAVTGRSSAPENTAQGAGVVDTFTFQETGANLPGTVTGSCGKPAPNHLGSAGTFVRVASEVVVILNCRGTITNFASNQTATFTNTTVRVIAQFVPTTGNGVTTPATLANFSGTYELVA